MSEKGDMYERFDESVQQIVMWAQGASINAKVGWVYPESFAVAILSTGPNSVNKSLNSLGIDLRKCLQEVKKELAKKRESKHIPNFQDLKIDSSVHEMCEVADRIREEMNRKYIELSHVFLALLQVNDRIRKIFEDEKLCVKDFIRKIGAEAPSNRNRRQRASSHSESASLGPSRPRRLARTWQWRSLRRRRRVRRR